eukprot:m.131561 g.131561  ORF g.131561 m.131561 type:complete len:173 (-) comp23737_c0_seq3:1210-1728(-)
MSDDSVVTPFSHSLSPRNSLPLKSQALSLAAIEDHLFVVMENNKVQRFNTNLTLLWQQSLPKECQSRDNLDHYSSTISHVPSQEVLLVIACHKVSQSRDIFVALDGSNGEILWQQSLNPAQENLEACVAFSVAMATPFVWQPPSSCSHPLWQKTSPYHHWPTHLSIKLNPTF